MPKAAIIGAGHVGSALGRRLLQAGWQVQYGSRDPSRSSKLAHTLREQPEAQGARVAEAVAWGECIILAVPGSAMATDTATLAVARSLGPHAAGKVLVDATNPLDGEMNELCWERGRSSAELLQEALPESLVYKAFNTVGVEHMAHPEGQLVTGQRLTLMFAGAAERQEEVASLIRAVGFTPEWVGHVRYARNLEALAELYIHLGAGVGGAQWGQPGGTRPFHFQVLRQGRQLK